LSEEQRIELAEHPEVELRTELESMVKDEKSIRELVVPPAGF
jgi:hypothetical protein